MDFEQFAWIPALNHIVLLRRGKKPIKVLFVLQLNETVINETLNLNSICALKYLNIFSSVIKSGFKA